MPLNEDSKAQDIVKLHEQLSTSRNNVEGQWQEIADRIFPTYSDTFHQLGKAGNRNRNYKRKELVYDSTATIALGRFGAILDSLLTPRNQTWHRVMASDPELNKDRTVQLWFEEFNRLMFKYRYAPKANFAGQNQQNYKSIGAFGTGCMFVDDLKGEPGLRYRAVHLGEIYFRENHQGLIDTALRYFTLTARQILQNKAWENAIPKAIREAAKTNADKEFDIIHCVMPREEIEYGRADFKGMAYASYYVTTEGPTTLSERGYTSFPYAISRYEQAPGEVYGRSPAMEVLPTIKTLNAQMRTILKQGQRAVDPVLLAHDDGALSGFNLTSGAINYGAVNSEGRPLVHALPTGRLDIGKELMEDGRTAINDAFLVTLFQILVETPTRTATEVLELAKEKGILLAPTVGRQQSEYLGPMIEREADLLLRQGLIGPMPQLLIEAGAEYRIEYDSPLSRAMRAEEAAGLMRTLETALKVAVEAQNPEILDHFNFDEIIPELSSIQGIPAKWLRGAKEIEAMRQGRQDQAQAEQMVQGAPSAAALIKAQAAQQKVA